MLQERLGKIKEYFVGMEMYNGLWVVRVKYRPKWGAYPPEDGRIKVVSDENESDLWWYCANDEDVDIDSILDLIEETIQTNMEAIKKVELFKLKAGELKQIFSDESISLKKLQTLRFVFDENSDKEAKPVEKVETKKKVASKKELITQVDDEIKEHDVFTSKPAVVEEVVTKKRVSKQKPVTRKSVVETTTPEGMTQAEIDDLRG
jgi:hypothetical protein